MEQPEVKEQVENASPRGNERSGARYLCRGTGGEFARAPGVSNLRNGARQRTVEPPPPPATFTPSAGLNRASREFP